MTRPTVTLRRADARRLPFADRSVQCVVTSPPYFGLRDYGMRGQIGLERTVDAYVTELVSAFREVRRVLKDDGVCWLNLGDSYAGGGKAGSAKALAGKQGSNRGSFNMIGRAFLPPGLAQKQLIGIPWRVAFALQADGWYLRSDIIWHKPNPMPESVTDRPTKSHEYLFLLTKSATYFYDHIAIKEPTAEASGWAKQRATPGSRNRRTVWTINTQPYKGAHFATMPERLVEPCVLAGSRPGDVVLDPFAGSGTVGAVAVRYGRSFVGTDLNPAYLTLARQRIGKAQRLVKAQTTVERMAA